MPTDLRGEAVTGPLQNYSIEYRNRRFYADQVFPFIDNVPINAKIWKYNKGDMFRLIDGDIIRYPGTEAKRGEKRGTYTNIHTIPYAFAAEVTDEDRSYANFMNTPPLSPDMKALRYCNNQILLQREYRVSSLIQGTTWSGGNNDAEGGWTVATGSTFEADVFLAVNTIVAATACDPMNLKMIMDYKTATIVTRDVDLLEKYKYVKDGKMPLSWLAQLFGIGEVISAGSRYNTDDETYAGTDWVGKYFWESNTGKGGAFLYYWPDEVGLDMLTAGGIFRTGQGEGAQQVYTFREPGKHQDVYEVGEETDEVAICADLGYLWTDTHTT